VYVNFTKNMKEIFKKIEGIEWDWFGCSKLNPRIDGGYLTLKSTDNGRLTETYSLADLLANKSWTEACGLSWKQVRTAFNHLRERGEKEAIEFIKEFLI